MLGQCAAVDRIAARAGLDAERWRQLSKARRGRFVDAWALADSDDVFDERSCADSADLSSGDCCDKGGGVDCPSANAGRFVDVYCVGLAVAVGVGADQR